MGLKSELQSEVGTIFRSSWSERDGDKVPEAENLRLGNDAVKLKGTVLYADPCGLNEARRREVETVRR